MGCHTFFRKSWLELGVQLGADVPVLSWVFAAFAEGVGEKASKVHI